MEQNRSQVPVNGKAAVEKKRRVAKVLIIIVCLVIAAVTSAYFFLPGLLRPYDLGVNTSEKAYNSAIQKLRLIKDKAPLRGKAEDYKYSYGKPQTVDTAFDSEEITSFFNVNRPPYYALDNVQVRINKDKTLETAATINTAYVLNDMIGGKYSKDDVLKALPMLKFLPEKVNFYCKMSGTVKGNELEGLDLKKVSIMGVSIPEKYINSTDAEGVIKDTVGNFLDKAAAKSAERYDLLEVNEGKLVFKGQVPSSITRISMR